MGVQQYRYCKINILTCVMLANLDFCFQNPGLYESNVELEGLIKQAARDRLRLEQVISKTKVKSKFIITYINNTIC